MWVVLEQASVNPDSDLDEISARVNLIAGQQALKQAD